MSSKKSPVKKADEPRIARYLGWKMDQAFEACGTECNEVAAVVIRAIRSKPNSTVFDLRTAWERDLGTPPNDEVIERALVLRILLGPEWHVIYLHHHLLAINDDVRGVGETRKNCPLFGDDVEEVRGFWERIVNEYDAKLAAEEAAAKRWADRNARKAA